MKILVGVNSEVWDGNSLVQYLQHIQGYIVKEAKSSYILLEMLKSHDEFDLAIISQDLIGLKDEENYISKIRDLVPGKSNKRVIFQMTHNIEKIRDELINEHFFDFLNGQFKPDELIDLIENPRGFDDVRAFQIRTVKRVIEKEKTKETIIKEEVLTTKVLPNKIVGFHGTTATTTLWNTAVGLAKDEDLKIILLDLNPNTHLTIHFCYDKYLNIRCMSELVEYIRKDKLNKDTINHFLVQHRKYKNIYLLPGFKKLTEKNFFDFPEAEEGNYLSKILYYLKRNSNVVLVDTPRQFFFGATIDTVKEAESMYFLTTPYLPNRIDVKTATKFFCDKEHNNDFKLVITATTGQEQVTSKAIFEELREVKEYGETGNEIGSTNIFNSYLEVVKVNNMSDITEDRKCAYEINELDRYKSSIDRIVRDIYYYEGGTYGQKPSRKSNSFSFGKKFSIPGLFSRHK